MELISTDDYFIFQHVQKGDTNLWCCRHSGRFEVRPSWDLAGQENPECLGIVWGLYGKLAIHPDLPERLVVVRHCERVGDLPGRGGILAKHSVYKVSNVVAIPLLPPALLQSSFVSTGIGTSNQTQSGATSNDSSLGAQLQLKPCPKHHGGVIEHPDFQPTTSGSNFKNSAFGKIGGSLKLLATDTIKSTLDKSSTARGIASQVKVPWKTNGAKSSLPINKSLERYERRILEEFLKLFNDANSFYFSLTGDITNSLQRQVFEGAPSDGIGGYNNWLSNLDDRFFFNKALVQELIDMEDTRVYNWITPFIQGYIELQDCKLNWGEADQVYSDFQNTNQMKDDVLSNMGRPMLQPGKHLPEHYTIAIISRRSRHRAGTRYKRRGVNEEGHVANYVETEQILLYHHYALSFLLVRGSVPIHWSQPGYKYRPPPRLDRTPEEAQAAFSRHFNTEFAIYGPPVYAINLAEKFGRERVISEAYLDHSLWYNNPDLHFVSFDFHDACRGMHFENVSILTDAIAEQVRGLHYTWLDKHGVVCTQTGVVRVNCIDCLDRTNVVQTAIAKLILETQLTKLGVVPPEPGCLPDDTRLIFQSLWANNGDALSRQYAGTNALKGDFTRTGERNLSGLMKDGMNSASRYYLNQFRDAYRQATIDLMTGQISSESILGQNVDDLDSAVEQGTSEGDTERTGEGDEYDSMRADQVRAIIEDCKRLLIPDLNSILGSWGLIDADQVTGDPSQEDMDIIFILTQDSYYLAHYDDDVDKVTQYQRVAFHDVESIEFGIPEESPFQFSFRKNVAKSEHVLRVSYRMPAPTGAVFYEDGSTATVEIGTVSGYFHALRSCNLRFFNNMALVVKTDEDRLENLKCVADSLAMAMEMVGIPIEVSYPYRLDKRKSKIPDAHSNYNAAVGGSSRSRTPLAVQALKGVSSKLAFSNMTSQISKLNPLAKLKQTSTKRTILPSEGQHIPTIQLEGARDSGYDAKLSSQFNLEDQHCTGYSGSFVPGEQSMHHQVSNTTQPPTQQKPRRQLPAIPQQSSNTAQHHAREYSPGMVQDYSNYNRPQQYVQDMSSSHQNDFAVQQAAQFQQVYPTYSGSFGSNEHLHVSTLQQQPSPVATNVVTSGRTTPTIILEQAGGSGRQEER